MQNTENLHRQQAQKLADYIISTDLQPIPLAEEFFYASLPLCVIDAVFSISVTYVSTRNTVIRFCEHQDWTRISEDKALKRIGQHTIGQFLHLFDDCSPEHNAEHLFKNRQRTSSRSGILKAEAVQKFALALHRAGIDNFCDLTEDRLLNAKTNIQKIPGQKSGISFNYFQMLAGNDDLVKTDRMVQGFIGKALGLKPECITPSLASPVVKSTILLLAQERRIWSARQLDYAIWV